MNISWTYFTPFSVAKKYSKRKAEYILKNKKVLLAKIFIPDEFCHECLDNLKTMESKINHGSLFPDLAGAVEICKIDLGLDKLK